MKVLFVYPFYGLGGVETAVLSRMAALRQIGVDAESLFLAAYASGGDELATGDGVTVGLEWSDVQDFLRPDFDAIVAIDAPEVVELCEVERLGIPLLVESHVSYPPAFERLYGCISNDLVQAVVVPSEFNRLQILKATSSAKPVHVLPNALDEGWAASTPTPPARRVDTRAQLLWIGRLEDPKNPEAFMRIGRLLLDRDCHVDMILVGDSPEYRNARRRLLEQISSSVRKRITFLRAVPHRRMREVYQAVAASGGCLVSTSRNESSPMTFLEAMAVGCPVVSSSVGGVGELVLHGETGFLFPLEDDMAAVNLIERLVDPAMDRERARITDRALSFVRERSDPRKVAEAYRSVLQQALAGFQPMGSTTAVRLPREPSSSTDAVSEEVHGGAGETVPGLVSVIIPVFNRLELLKEAVDSVLTQTYSKLELILVDDGSEIETATYCDQLAASESRVSAVHIDHVGRPGLVREQGRRRARGEFIQYLDSDDLLRPRKLEVMVRALLDDPEADIAYCYTRRYRRGDRPQFVPAEFTGKTFATLFPWFLLRRFWFTVSPLYRRTLSDSNGPWPDLPFMEDVEYDTRIARTYPKLVHCREFLADFRDHEGTRASKGSFVTDPETLKWGVAAHHAVFRHARDSGLGGDSEPMRLFLEDVRMLQAKCADFGLEDERSLCEAMIREVLPEGLPAQRLRAALQPLDSRLEAEPGDQLTARVRVLNESNITLRYGACAHGLSYHLRAANGEMLVFDNPRLYFMELLRPGEARDYELQIEAPSEPGDYVIELDLLWETITWFADQGSPTTSLELTVFVDDDVAPEHRLEGWLEGLGSADG